MRRLLTQYVAVVARYVVTTHLTRPTVTEKERFQYST